MKIAFFNIAVENMATSLLSAIAKKEGHFVKLFNTTTIFKEGLSREFPRLANFFNYDKKLFKQIKAFQPDLIAFSVVTFHYRLSLYYAEICRKICPNAKIVFGGIHVSCVPEIVIENKFIDYIVIGEGEIAFLEIIKHIQEDDYSEPIVNTWYKSKNGKIIKGRQIGFIQNLDSLPQIDKGIWEEMFHGSPYYITITSRGCPYNCSYCFNHFFRNLPEEKSCYVRRRSVKHVMEELKTNKEKYNFKLIEFWDDIFILDKKWLKEFLDAYKKDIALPFKCYIHVNLFDEEIAIWLKEAGCKWVDFGIQHINEEYRKKYLKRNESNVNIVNTLKLLKKHKIVSFADYIIGLPGDTIEHNEEARLFFLDNMPDIIEPYWMSYHPKTEIINMGYDYKILNDETMDLIKQGRVVDGYFSGALGSKDFHKEYYFIFKVLPSLPVFLRKKLTYSNAHKMPYFIKFPIFMYSIFYLAYKHKNPRMKAVIFYFTKHMFLILKKKYFSKI